jgi:hypothetical protein
MRGVDTAARYGGEEIALILPRTDMLSAYNVGERIRTAIAEQRVTTDSEPPKVLGVTASFGIAAYPETKVNSGEDLVRRADRALYRAKKTGKNRVELFWSDESGPARIPTIPPPPAKIERSTPIEKVAPEWPIERIDRSKPMEKVGPTSKLDRSKPVEKVEPVDGDPPSSDGVPKRRSDPVLDGAPAPKTTVRLPRRGLEIVPDPDEPKANEK